ncbi:S41 family peptidase [uncultured Massilia sp.]|uniref:S41 family peptidase n=1 Tax=uncultured Massilia sp. TaxID=169973 RepID=UPI0025E5C8B3|nr:S41 family peptidase [uncultured Massilia sp.]
MPISRPGAAFLAACLLSCAARADPVDGATRAQVVELLAARMAQHYVSADTGARVAAALRADLAQRRYEGVDDAEAFAQRLTERVVALSGDEHAGVLYAAQALAPDNPPGFVPDPGRTDLEGWLRRHERQLRAAQARSFGFPDSRRLDGNLAYVRIDAFPEPALAGPTLKAEMARVADAAALILDLRENGGGSADTVALLCAWLFDDVPVHLGDQVARGIGRVQPMWTQPVASDLRFGSRKPVYVLVGPETFSAAENLAYTLQALGRAVVVGARTRGGAHGANGFRLAEHFLGSIPSRRTVNAVTGTDWERTGVRPDVATAPAAALQAAVALARGATAP